MMVSFVCAHKRVRCTADAACIRAGIRPFLFLLAGTEGWLPRCVFSAWRGSNNLDLLFLWFLGFSIASLLAFCHVDLLGYGIAQIEYRVG
jgi:hypothetical protein